MCFAVHRDSRLHLTLCPNCDDIQILIFTLKFGLSLAQLFYIFNFHSCFKYSPATIYIVLQSFSSNGENIQICHLLEEKCCVSCFASIMIHLNSEDQEIKILLTILNT